MFTEYTERVRAADLVELAMLSAAVGGCRLLDVPVVCLLLLSGRHLEAYDVRQPGAGRERSRSGNRLLILLHWNVCTYIIIIIIIIIIGLGLDSVYAFHTTVTAGP